MREQKKLIFVGICGVALYTLACAGKSLRAGESAPLKDSSGKVFGTRYQMSDTAERHLIDQDQNGTPEKQYFFERDVLKQSEHFYPDGKIKVRTFFLDGKPNRAEVFHPDGRLRGVAYFDAQGNRIDTVDIPERKKRVEFLPPG